jgi:hypothetical protein
MIMNCNYYVNNKLCAYSVASTSFNSNTALEGGAVSWDYVKITENNVSYNNNEAFYGDNIASKGNSLGEISLSSRRLSLVY